MIGEMGVGSCVRGEKETSLIKLRRQMKVSRWRVEWTDGWKSGER